MSTQAPDSEPPRGHAKYAELTPIERWIERDWVRFGRLATGLLVAAVLGLLMTLVWLSDYDRVIQAVARTEVLELSVSQGGERPRWDLGGAQFDCTAGSRTVGPGGSVTIGPGARVTILSKSTQDPAHKRLWLFSVKRGAAEAADAPPALIEFDAAGNEVSRRSAPLVMCLDAHADAPMPTLALRGALVLGDPGTPERAPAQMLLDGELRIIESPRWGRVWSTFNYQIEHERVSLQAGDQLSLASAGGCGVSSERCEETHGFARLGAGEGARPAMLTVNAVSTASAAIVNRPSRPAQRVQGSYLRRIAGDPALGVLISVSLFSGGIGWALIQLLGTLRRDRQASK